MQSAPCYYCHLKWNLNYDKSFPKFQDKKFYGHAINVPIKYELLESYLANLSKVNDIRLTKVVS